jgi:hypothetical protein
MSASDGQKQENLQLVRGGRYAERPARVFTSAELRLDIDMQALIGAVRGADGKHPTRGFRKVVYQESFPWRLLARYFVAAWQAGAPIHQLLPILARFDRFVRGLYGVQHDKAA